MEQPVYLSPKAIGELHRCAELIRYRRDIDQVTLLETWLTTIFPEFAVRVLAFDAEAAQVWGRPRPPDPFNTLDKESAAIALVN